MQHCSLEPLVPYFVLVSLAGACVLQVYTYSKARPRFAFNELLYGSSFSTVHAESNLLIEIHSKSVSLPELWVRLFFLA